MVAAASCDVHTLERVTPFHSVTGPPAEPLRALGMGTRPSKIPEGTRGIVTITWNLWMGKWDGWVALASGSRDDRICRLRLDKAPSPG